MGGYLIEIRINSLWSCAVEIADRGRRIAGDRAASLGQLSWMMKIYDDNDDGVEDDFDSDEDDKQRQKSSWVIFFKLKESGLERRLVKVIYIRVKVKG